MGASAMLDGQSERGAERSLETIGERVASDVASVNRLAREEPEPGIVELRVDHPNEVSGTTYSIEFREGNCGELIASGEPCVVLTAPGARTTVYVPLAVNDDPGIVSGTNTQGGEMRISYEEGESGITLGSGHE